MSTLSEDLRTARQQKQLTLQQVADITLVNLKFLEAIDHGDYSFMPQAYVRAFLREYAQVVGMDPKEAMERYERESAPEPPPTLTRAPEAPPPVEIPQAGPPAGSAGFSARPAWLVTAAIALFTLVVIVLALQDRPEQDSAVQEIPFGDMVRESERRAAENIPARPEPLPEELIPADSLTLLAVTLDSVWVQMTIDNQDPREYIFPPNRRATWKARNRFVVTVGNAGGIQFTLNQVSLGTLGVPGAVVRNVEFSRRTLDREQ